MDLLHKFFHWLWANAEPNKLLLEGTVSALGFLLANEPERARAAECRGEERLFGGDQIGERLV